MSTSYKGTHALLHWRCHEGHEWHASLHSIRSHGTWCPHCPGKARLSIDFAMRLARTRGGLCLSDQYKHRSAHLLWRCAEGHEWYASLTGAKSAGSWCPHCKIRKREFEIRQTFKAILMGQASRKSRPDFLRTGRRAWLELDGCCPSSRLDFEYNGKQHYDEDHYFHRLGSGRFSAQARRDQQKIAFCKAAGIRLVVIPYSVKDALAFVLPCCSGSQYQ